MQDYSIATDKVMLREQWESYIRDFANWKSFLTLTSRDILTRDQIENKWRWMVQVLNQNLYGNNYTRVVGHSYFSYVAGFEHQKRGALHMHVLVDQKIHFAKVHELWNYVAGWVLIKPVTDVARVVSYVSKYVVKEGDLTVWKQRKFKEPSFQPMWFQNRF